MEQGTAAARLCVKCSGEMEAGVLLDRSQAAIYPAIWADGPVERSLLGSLKPKERRLRRVVAWRCTGCGYLEFFAQQAVELYEYP